MKVRAFADRLTAYVGAALWAVLAVGSLVPPPEYEGAAAAGAALAVTLWQIARWKRASYASEVAPRLAWFAAGVLLAVVLDVGVDAVAGRPVTIDVWNYPAFVAGMLTIVFGRWLGGRAVNVLLKRAGMIDASEGSKEGLLRQHTDAGQESGGRDEDDLRPFYRFVAYAWVFLVCILFLLVPAGESTVREWFAVAAFTLGCFGLMALTVWLASASTRLPRRGEFVRITDDGVEVKAGSEQMRTLGWSDIGTVKVLRRRGQPRRIDLISERQNKSLRIHNSAHVVTPTGGVLFAPWSGDFAPVIETVVQRAGQAELKEVGWSARLRRARGAPERAAGHADGT